MSAAKPTQAEMLVEIKSEISHLGGEVKRLSARVDELTALKNKGAGVLLVLGILGSVVLLALQRWVAGLFPHSS